jgi:hypothetical protein
VQSRPGIALVTALGLMTLLGIMIAGAFAASLSSERASRLVYTDAQLSADADFAINTVLADPRGFRLAELPLGRTQSYVVALPNSANIQASVAATRLGRGVLWLVADVSMAGVDQGHRRVNLIARFPSLGPAVGAPVIARGSVLANDSVNFSADSSTDPECETSGAPDIIVAPGMTITAGDSVRTSVRENAADSVTFYLQARQLALLDSGASVVHVRGDTMIGGGQFSGIMVADGSITIGGPFEMAGLLIAGGSISALAGGYSITGAMLAYGANVSNAPTIEIAHAIVRFSPCAILTALRLALHPRPVIQRSWAELF